MIIARIRHPEREDRFCKLEQGQRSFGSDFDCDVVLTDDEIAPVLFEIDISPEGVTLVSCDDPDAIFATSNGDERPAASASGVDWTVQDRVRLGALTVDLRGDECNAPEVELTRLGAIARSLSERSTTIARAVLMFIGLVVTVGLGAGYLLGSGPSPANARIDASEDLSTTGADVPPALTQEDVRQKLVRMGLKPHDLRPSAGGWRVTFYVSSLAEKDAAEIGLLNTALPIEPRLVLDSALLGAANMVLRGLETEMTTIRVEDGVLHLTNDRSDTETQQALLEQIRKDVPGLRDVVIEAMKDADTAPMVEEIAGIWSGARSRVFMKDGRELRPGDDIDDTFKLVDVVGENVLLIAADGIEKRLVLP